MAELERIGIIGLGLIGGSIAAGLKRVGGYEIRAFDADPDATKAGLVMGIVDGAHLTVADLADSVDVLCLCTPVQSVTALLQELGGFEGVLTDVGSVKRPLIEAVSEHCPHMMPRLVPGHPIAGSERHGVRAASPELFLNHKVILTPSELSNPEAVQRIQTMWAAMGADVIEMAADHHDAVLAQTSHLPHLLAYTLVDVLAEFGDGREVFDYAAGGFRDFSRIAASDPEMWRDIFLSNKTALLRLIDTFQEALAETAALIENDQAEQLKDQLARAKSARDYFASIQSTSRHQ